MRRALVAHRETNRDTANARERGTLKSYREHVNLHILPRIGKLKLAKLTKGHIEHFRDGLISGVGDRPKLSRPTAAKVLRSLKAMLKVVGCSHLGDGVTIEISRRDKPKLEAGRDIPTPQEVARLVRAAKGKLRVLLMTAASTGLRSSELRGLPWRYVDLKAGELHVRQRADRWNKIGPPKSDSSKRTVPLGNELLHALKEWRIACPKEGELDLVFPTSTGAVQHHKNMLDACEAVVKAAGVVTKAGKPKYGLHAFRLSSPVGASTRRNVAAVSFDIYCHLFPQGSDRAELDAAEKTLFG